MQKLKENLDKLSSIVLKTYLDSVMFVTIIPIANNKCKTSNFLFDYSYYAIRERSIISAKSLIEPKGKNKLTIEKIIKDLQQKEEYKQYADELYLQYKELFDSEGAKRIKKFRDSLCHNIQTETMIYCKDILALINDVMKILDNIYQHIFGIKNENFHKIKYISQTLADDYWNAICSQADKMPNRNKELTELQNLLNC